MASTAVTTPPASGGGDADAASKIKWLEFNDTRITTAVNKLSILSRTKILDLGKRKNFRTLCATLSRGLDYALANHVVPVKAQELLFLVKQICKFNGDDKELQGCIMTLLFSLKGACQVGWYPDPEDIEEVMKLLTEIASNFGIVSSLVNEPSTRHHSVISIIMSRFYPRQKMGQILVFADTKPGYAAYLSDFQILKSFPPPGNIFLFVVQTDSVETSSCLISPPQVIFLLNGKPVERRINQFTVGPQMSTAVKPYLLYGCNLLQAVGEFNGHYIIAMALMSEVPSPGSDGLQDYVPATLDSDPDIIEGPSRISLNCPISFRRIKTPVKGHLCNHIQCFDFDNYVEMNSRCPLWRCPHCNQPVCFTDLRIDQKIAKILKEVGPKVNAVVVSSDGSWKNDMETDDATQKPDGKTSSPGEDDSENCSSPTSPVDVLDLTGTDDVMDGVVTHETEEKKADPVVSQDEFSAPSTNMNNVNVNGDSFWSGIYRSTFGAGSSNAQQNPNHVASPLVLESNITPVPNREIEGFHGSNGFTTSSVAQREYGTLPQLQPRSVPTTPVAVQALPSMQTPYSVQRSRSTTTNFMRQNSLPTASQGPLLSPVNTNSTIRSSTQAPHLSSPALNQYPGLQRNAGLQSQNQAPFAYRTLHEHQNSSQHTANMRMPQGTNQSPRSLQSPPTFMRPQSQVGAFPDRGNYRSGGVGSQNSLLLAAANRTAERSVDSFRSISPYSGNNNTAGLRTPSQGGGHRVNAGVMPQPLTRNNSFDSPDPNWRPAGRMRGALTGQAYNDAMEQFINRPTQQAQAHASTPMSSVASLPANVQSRLADRATQGSPPNSTPAGPSSNQGI